jgi:hypothetical protein
VPVDRIEQVQNDIRRLREVMVVALAVEHGLDSRAAYPLVAGYMGGVAEAMFAGMNCNECGGPEFEVLQSETEVVVRSACHHNHQGVVSWPV